MTSAYPAAMGIALYIAADPWDLQREVQRCTHILAAPSSHDWRRAVRIGKYLQGSRSAGTLLRLDPGLARASGKVLLDMFGDSDHAGCVATRRSVSCGVFMLDGAAVAGFSRRQGAVGLSSGESELYAASAVVADGKSIFNLVACMGYDVEWRLQTDSSACKSIMRREGCGRVRHLEMRCCVYRKRFAPRT